MESIQNTEINTPSDAVVNEASTSEQQVAQPTESSQSSAAEVVKQREASRAKLFAERARQDRELVRTRKEAENLKKELAQHTQKLTRAKDDPVGFLSEVGYDYEKLTKRYLDSLDDKKAVDPVQEKLDRMQKQLEERERVEAERAEQQLKQEQQAIVRKHLNDVQAYCNANADKYECTLADAAFAQRAYLDIYKQAFELVGRDLSNEEVVRVLDRVEELAYERDRTTLDRLSKTKKLQQKVESQKIVKPAEVQEKKSAAASEQFRRKYVEKPKVKTLTNSISKSSAYSANSSAPVGSEEWHKQKLAEIAKKYDNVAAN